MARKNTNKTVATKASVKDFLQSLDNAEQRRDCEALRKMMQAATGKRAKMWGTSIVGFGQYHYKYDSGREGDHLLVGFAPRKQNTVIYIMPGFSHWPDLMANLGKYKTGKSCLYIKRLSDLNPEALKPLIERSVVYMREKYDCA